MLLSVNTLLRLVLSPWLYRKRIVGFVLVLPPVSLTPHPTTRACPATPWMLRVQPVSEEPCLFPWNIWAPILIVLLLYFLLFHVSIFLDFLFPISLFSFVSQYFVQCVYVSPFLAFFLMVFFSIFFFMRFGNCKVAVAIRFDCLLRLKAKRIRSLTRKKMES